MTTITTTPTPTPSNPSADRQLALQLTGISKSFPGVKALSDVLLSVRAGEIHALVGENGAGKSTLMAIASGALAADSGTVEIGGIALGTASPNESRRLGLAIVRQHPALLPDLTVAENLALGVGLRRVGGLGAARKWSQPRLDSWEMGISAADRVSDLTVEQRFIVEIAKALALEPRVLILDEPTEHLNVGEIERLFSRMRELAASGSAIVYISHRIPEVKRIADRISVLRDGQSQGTFEASSVTESQIIERAIGRKLDTVFPDKTPTNGAELFVVHDLRGDAFESISLAVRAGEIVGLAGVQGNGQSELIRALAGVESSSGSITVGTKRVRPGSNASASAAGIVYVPANRQDEGLLMPLSVGTNAAAKIFGRVSRLGFVSGSKVAAVGRAQIERFGIKTPSTQTPVSSLSGGNQQKVMLSRAMLAEPRVLLAEEPTQGVDAGARVDIYRILRDAADEGAAVVVLSSDNVELQGLCDRVIVMSRGEIIDELTGDGVTEAAIGRAALSATGVRERHEGGSRSGGWRRWLRGDQSPAAVVLLVSILLAVLVDSNNSGYLSVFNLANNILFPIAALLFVGAAQQVVVLGSGFDLSVGPLMGVITVIGSFFLIDGGNLYVGLGIIILSALLTGAVNGLLVNYLRINPVVTTLAMYIALQGVYLTLRPTPAGTINTGITNLIETTWGSVPAVTVIAVILLLILEVLLRRTKWGLDLRAAGSNVDTAVNLGVKVRRSKFFSYVIASALVIPAGLILMAQVGIGDGTPSVSYTLSSITLVVLAGGSIFGGRGSFIGILAAGLLAQQVLSAPQFLGLSQAWGYWLPGLVTVIAATFYAQLRRSRTKRRNRTGAQPAQDDITSQTEAAQS
jgi:ribose transport system ATP-binding protein